MGSISASRAGCGNHRFGSLRIKSQVLDISKETWDFKIVNGIYVMWSSTIESVITCKVYHATYVYQLQKILETTRATGYRHINK
jgi:hypothetical protein